MEKSALIVVDMQKDFCTMNSPYNKAGYPVKQNKKLSSKIIRLIDLVKREGAKVYFLLSNYDTYSPDNRKLTFCKSNTVGSESYLPIAMADKIIIKTTHDGFYNTDLETKLKKDHVENLLVAGISTSVCVDATARSGICRGFNVTIVSDCVASRNKKWHDYSLENFKENFGEVRDLKYIEENLQWM